ncbi:glycosyltransferase family 4 protein [Microbulbifer sp. TYP-18]|uniref:glycosyltransferase family 4 protein n=1 Tax=Microbulbifer sp. TYP-18 TaxID=3230024 RepID=UPI0034C6AB95
MSVEMRDQFCPTENKVRLVVPPNGRAAGNAGGLPVLVLAWEYPPFISGGLGVACKGLCEEMALRPELAVRVALPDTSERQREGIASAYLGADELLVETRTYAEQLAEYCRREPCSVVHSHDWLTFSAALRLQQSYGIPFIAHVHSLEIDRAPTGPDPVIVRIEQEAFEKAAAIVAVSQYTKRRIVRAFGVDPAKVTVVHNGITPAFEKRPLPAPLEQRPRRVTFVGRLTTQKGPDIFLSTAELLAQRDATIEFSMVGTGDMSNSLQLRALETLGKRVSFHGFLNQAEVAEILAHSRLMVMPSRSEPFGIAAVEAIQLGTPVVASRSVGFVEAVPAVPTVDISCVGEMAQVSARLLDEVPMARALAGNAAAQLRGLTWEKAAELMASLILDVSQVHPPGVPYRPVSVRV